MSSERGMYESMKSIGAARQTSLTKVGDELQSGASRMAEWILALPSGEAPYEVQMAALEARSAVDDWTDCRKGTPREQH